jgi:hypothetical protein
MIINMTKTKKVITIFTNLFITILAGLVTLSLLFWFNYPLPKMISAQVNKQNTPTPNPPTATLRPTRTPRNTATTTPSPSPTITLMPTSAFQVIDVQLVDPPIPGNGVGAIILDENNALVNPPFTDIQWIPSSKISEDIGREISEPYYATWGAGSILWKTDVNLAPSYYEIFVLDTLYSSAGTLDFAVNLGSTMIKPLFGSNHVVYKSAQGNPPQIQDEWHSIGIYDIKDPDILSISTSWEKREQQNVVAVDRVLILQLPDSVRTIYQKLPQDHEVFVVDDAAAKFDTFQYWESRSAQLAWGDYYQVMTNPPIVTQVTWEVVNDVPVDRYEIQVWIPDINGTAEVSYKVFVNGVELKPENNQSPIKLMQGKHKGSQWLSLGFWKIPSAYGAFAKISLQIETETESVGEIVVDAAAFIRSP